ncbi:ABC transporter ATP-binding protein [Halovenus rubra]|uniref:ABC transporter ATP-binding protein n=2 Tax=Halovenus rubra TaxID=869890 RepID=A0ABD5X798_9EURY|nr:ABC transporter ATP-binding protein [Halovenus rubra]
MASERSQPVITTTDLRKEYGSTVAVDDISLEIEDGEIFGLLGPNGAGKTTAIEIIQGLRTPTSGEATVLGLDIQTDLHKIKDRIGVVPQSFHTFERLTVRENVALIANLHTEPLAVDDVLDELALREWADDPFHSLSGGYQRRTGIAMALVGDPDVLFLDEPTTGLDPAARRATWEQIEQLPAMGTTVVLTTHYMEEVEYLADRVALLVDGHVKAIDTVPALINTYAGELKVVVHLDESTTGTEADALEATLRETADSVHKTDADKLIGVFGERQAAQDTYSELHDIGTGHSIDLVSPDMEDVFLTLADSTLSPGGELQ